jgi:hypothetical protein
VAPHFGSGGCVVDDKIEPESVGGTGIYDTGQVLAVRGKRRIQAAFSHVNLVYFGALMRRDVPLLDTR